MKSLNIIFLGRSGSGKGTQAELLSKKFSLINIDTGDILRALAKKEDKFGTMILKTITQGQLVPAWLVVYCWLNRLLKIAPEKGVIMEGCPRRLEEAKILEEVFIWLGRENFKVIYLRVPEKEATERLLARRICFKCGREFSLYFTPQLKKCSHCQGKLVRRQDDYPGAIKNRMLFFQKKILPVINYFRKKRILIEVDGEGSVEDIHQRIFKKLKSKM